MYIKSYKVGVYFEAVQDSDHHREILPSRFGCQFFTLLFLFLPAGIAFSVSSSINSQNYIWKRSQRIVLKNEKGLRGLFLTFDNRHLPKCIKIQRVDFWDSTLLKLVTVSARPVTKCDSDQALSSQSLCDRFYLTFKPRSHEWNLINSLAWFFLYRGLPTLVAKELSCLIRSPLFTALSTSHYSEVDLMGYHLRYQSQAWATHHVVSRCVRGYSFLRPTPEVVATTAGVLGRALHGYSHCIKLHHYAFLSNHFHLLLSSESTGALSEFMKYLKSNLTRELARIHEWTGPHVAESVLEWRGAGWRGVNWNI